MQINIFIGSSKEGLSVARRVKKCLGEYLSDAARCTIWSDNFFTINVATFDNLCAKAPSYDFAVLIGTKDDTSIVREQEYRSIRDNVIFEYGLFTGSIGRERTFILREKGVKLPSDLSGVTLPEFENSADLRQSCADIAKHIEDEMLLSRISMLPSTASAIAYYRNFVKPVCESIYQSHALKDEISGSIITLSIRNVSLNVVLPDELQEDLNPFVNHFVLTRNYRASAIMGASRSHSLYYKQDGADVVLMDVPTNLNSSYIAVRLFSRIGFIGNDEDFNRYMQKEINNFRMTLSTLLKGNGYTEKLVKILDSGKL